MEATQAVMQAYSAAVTYGPVHHGGRCRTKTLDPAKAGTGTVGCNASGGIYFTSDYGNALFYADSESIERLEFDLADSDCIAYGCGSRWYVLIADKINPGIEFESEGAAETWMAAFCERWNAAEPGDIIHEDDMVLTATLSMHNPLIVDSLDEFRKVEPTAKADGFDGIIAYDIFDGCMYSDVYVVFESKQITLI